MIARDFIAALAGVMAAASAMAATVEVDVDSSGMGEITWSEKKLANGTSRLSIKAKAKAGYAFTGWEIPDDDIVSWTQDFRYSGPLTAVVASNAVVLANFSARADDTLSFDITDFLGDELVYGETVSQTISVDSLSFPTLTFEGLPDGLDYDTYALAVFGKPTQPGRYEIKATGVNESGFTFSSFATVRVANVEGARVSGVDTEIPLGEYFAAEIGTDYVGELFTFAEIPDRIILSGSVPGLEWREDWSLLYGTPTEIGEYTLKVTAHFPTGAVETATMSLTVAGADPENYGIDFEPLSELQVGDELVAEDSVIARNDAALTVNRVRGLPNGLSAKSWMESGRRVWGVDGVARVAGRYAVAVDLTDLSGTTQRVVTVCRTVTVTDVPDGYLEVSSADSTRGTVSGGGAISVVDEATLAAHPQNGYVFSGWYDSDGDRLILKDGVDYRTQSVKLPAGSYLSGVTAVAHFAAKSDDVAPDLSELADSDFSFSPDETFEAEFSIESLSLPTLTFKGLPKRIACSATGSGGFVLTYDPADGEISSGRHTVTITAVNSSGKKSSATFRVTVEPLSDARINVYGDYGEFTPGETIDPISFADAVDFAHGETLSVSGLPKGLTYNAKANPTKGIQAHTVTGKPTVPGEYTLKFSAKVISTATTNESGKVTYKYTKASATAFLTVLPYPRLEVDIDDDAASAGCKIAGVGNYKSGTKVTLTATAAKGWVFAGWEGFEDVDGLLALNPKLPYVTGSDDVMAHAYFTTVDQDELYVDAPVLTDNGFAAEWQLRQKIDENGAELIADLIDTVSWPTVKVEGLPTGVKFSSSTLLLSGAPTKSGVCHVTVTARNAGGYSFVRVFDVAVLNADGTLPEVEPLANAAEIDFTPLVGLKTGVYYQKGSIVLTVGPKPESESPVRKVAVKDLPSGLSTVIGFADAAASVSFSGTPNKPGRHVVSVSVTYADGKTLKSQAAIVVEDGGSYYLYVTTDETSAGTVSGGGVYASGATVKLVAKPSANHVFAGWCSPDLNGEYSLFLPLRDIDDIDPRTTTVAFPFRPSDLADAFELRGAFADVSEDLRPDIVMQDESWAIDPAESSIFAFAVDSLSLPSISVSGLPEGVSVDAARGVMTYVPTASAAPGLYTVTIKATNGTGKKRKTTTSTLELWLSTYPQSTCGTFFGTLSDAEGAVVGTVKITSTATGKVSVKMKTTAKAYSFAVKKWDTVSNGVVSVVTNDRKGVRLELSIADSTDWRSWQVSGNLEDEDIVMDFTAQRDSFGISDGDEEARQVVSQMVGKQRIDGWLFKIDSTGVAKASGLLNGARVSRSSIVQCDNSEYFARFVILKRNSAPKCLVFHLDGNGAVISRTVE